MYIHYGREREAKTGGGQCKKKEKKKPQIQNRNVGSQIVYVSGPGANNP